MSLSNLNSRIYLKNWYWIGNILSVFSSVKLFLTSERLTDIYLIKVDLLERLIDEIPNDQKMLWIHVSLVILSDNFFMNHSSICSVCIYICISSEIYYKELFCMIVGDWQKKSEIRMSSWQEEKITRVEISWVQAKILPSPQAEFFFPPGETSACF